MDLALKVARETQVRVILPFIDWWNWRGGVEEFAAFRGKSRWEFFTDPLVREDFKHLIEAVVMRRNTITGLLYKDDEYILGWELGNELGGWSGMAPTNWIKEMSAFIKSIDPEHLVMDGSIGIVHSLGNLEGPNHTNFLPLDTKLDVYNKSGILADPNIDMFRDHYYVTTDDGQFSRWAEAAAAITSSFQKAFVVSEFGFASSTVFRMLLQTVVDNKAIAGALIWSLRPHSYYGGFYMHQEKDSWLSYRLPGFQPEDGAPVDESSTTLLIREFAWEVQGVDHTQQGLPKPQPPEIIPFSTPKRISWRGSPMAYAYAIARAITESDEDPEYLQWNILADNLFDGTLPGQNYVSDNITIECVFRSKRGQSITLKRDGRKV
ncbi:hypothetical protein HDV05_006060 [Chytridiales sp. JEL 0842]|nr:hypothetical protein HDV05_006060 [Chytridiales sp. JEL 0842]